MTNFPCGNFMNGSSFFERTQWCRFDDDHHPACPGMV